MKKGYYTADTINGVTFHGETLEEDVDVTSPSIFRDLLKTLGDDEVIYTFMDEADEKIYEEIDQEYGIR